MSRKKPSPSHIERVRQRNQQIAQPQREFRESVFGQDPLRVIADTDATISIPTPGSISLADLQSATVVLRDASPPISAYVQSPDVVGSSSPRKKLEPKPVARTDIWQKKYPDEGWRVIAMPQFQQRDLLCCGAKEIYGINGQICFQKRVPDDSGRYYPVAYQKRHPIEIVSFIRDNLVDVWHRRNRPFIIFTEIKYPVKDGDKLPGAATADFIEEQKLGTVVRVGPYQNENSENYLYMYTYTPDKEKLLSFKIDNHLPVA